MGVSYSPADVSAVFDDPNLVSCAGLAPVVSLAHRAGLADVVSDTVTLPGEGAANAACKCRRWWRGWSPGRTASRIWTCCATVGWESCSAASGRPRRWARFYARLPSATHYQFDTVAAGVLSNLAQQYPVLSGVDQVAYVDVDDTNKATHGYAKQGVGYGYSGTKGLNALIATVSTPVAAPVIAATRLRKGNTNSARGAAKFVADALATARRAGAGGLTVLRADSAYYNHDVVAAARRSGARFSITARMNPAVVKSVTRIPDDAWTPIRYPNATFDEEGKRWVSDAEVADIGYTAFTSKAQAEQVTGRLIVRCVKRLNPASVPAGQGELFAAYRQHAVFTDSPLPMLDAETNHRIHDASRWGNNPRHLRHGHQQADSR
jgi:Transposase DDE domain group 1